MAIDHGSIQGVRRKNVIKNRPVIRSIFYVQTRPLFRGEGKRKKREECEERQKSQRRDEESDGFFFLPIEVPQDGTP